MNAIAGRTETAALGAALATDWVSTSGIERMFLRRPDAPPGEDVGLTDPVGLTTSAISPSPPSARCGERGAPGVTAPRPMPGSRRRSRAAGGETRCTSRASPATPLGALRDAHPWC